MAQTDEKDEKDEKDKQNKADAREAAEREADDDDEEAEEQGESSDSAPTISTSESDAGDLDEETAEALGEDAESGETQAAKPKRAPRRVKTARAAKPAPVDDDGDEDEGSAEPAGEGEEAAARVAEALGLDDETGEAAVAADAEEEPARNRAARRREEALERRRKKKGGDAKSSAALTTRRATSDDEALPKDKNARAKELLQRRREEAAGRRPVDLLPSEMVDDALSRLASSSGRWVRENFSVIQWGLVAAAVIGGGVMLYTHFGEQSAMAASSALATAVADERGKVMLEDKRPDEEKETDPSKIFKTAEERQDAALGGYNHVIDKYKGTGPAILAKLGQAGVYLDKKDFPHALEAYSAVLATSLAAADPDVKGRAIEGIGFAKEGKGDLDGALASFKELEGVDVKPYKELSLYHQARISLAKGDKDKAKELLKSAREKLQSPAQEGHPFQFLEAVVDDELRKIDPSAVPARAPTGGATGARSGGNQMTQEEIQALLKRAQESAEKKAKENGGK